MKKVGDRITCMVWSTFVSNHIYLGRMLIESLTMVAAKDGTLHDLTFLYHFMLLGISLYYLIIIKIK